MNSSHGQLSALVALISDATKIVEAHFAKSSMPYVPSLDDTEPHPLDIMSDSMELRIAIQTIEGACAQLSATVARPSHTILNKTLGIAEPTCLEVVLAYKIPDILQQKPNGMHCSEIAKRTGLHQPKVERIMRMLAVKHIFREITEGVFVNNRLSVQLLSTNPLSSACRYNTQEVTRTIPHFLNVLGDKDWGHSDSPMKTAFNKATGYSKTLFDYYSGNDSAEGAALGVRFALGMVGWGYATEGTTVINEFPWEELPKGTTIVDVGSGIGAVTMGLAKRYPSLHITLQDLPERMLQAQNEIWPKECPEAMARKGVQFKPIDFFTQSPVPGADIYYLKNILHDWEDGRCVTILSNIRKAMGPHSRVLIHEYIIQKANRLPDDKSVFKQAPEPLLPNYGVGRLRMYAVDMHMMIMINSVERPLQAFNKLGEAAGLRFFKLWDLGETSIVEFRLPDARESGRL